MNIRYPIYEGVYRILTLDGYLPGDPYHAYDREREGLCHQRIGRDRLLGYGRRQDRLESGRRQEVRAYDRKMGHVRVSAGLR